MKNYLGVRVNARSKTPFTDSVKTIEDNISSVNIYNVEFTNGCIEYISN